MPKRARLSLAGWIALLLCGGASSGGAQDWNSDRALALVRMATDLRARQLADTGLADYHARAHGYLTFLAQMGEGYREPPRVVKADELALEVYWRAPNLSKQRIIGRRDTTLLPTDIQYHRDHLGIVQNNFPAIIRLGDGDEVRDVPHPLSPLGMAQYEFAITDSLRIAIPGRVIGVYEVKVRPVDDRRARVIGALYLDRDNGQVVRMALSFTRAAFLDRQLEDLFVVLENGLVGTRFWLPRRQEIEIRRTATWLDYPVRGIIRGRWEISDYEINQGLPPTMFAGPEIVAAPTPGRPLHEHEWPSASILDSLPPDVRAATQDEIRRIQDETRALVREDALRRARGSALAARGLSDFARFNRVEGLALGGGLTGRLGGFIVASGRARYGLADESAKGQAEIRYERASGAAFRVRAGDDFRELGLVAERSTILNSLAAQEFASDYTNPWRVRFAGVGVMLPVGASAWTLDVTRERHSALAVTASPANGTFRPTIPAASLDAWRAAVRLDQPTRGTWWDLTARGHVQLSAMRANLSNDADCVAQGIACAPFTTFRASGLLELNRQIGGLSLHTRTLAAAVVAAGDGPLPAQELVVVGGPVSVPGYEFHELVGDRVLVQRIELGLPVPFPAISLGRFGRSGNRATLAPHVTGAWLRAVPPAITVARAAPLPGGAPDPLRPRGGGFYPAMGVSLLAGFDLLRFDVSRGLRDGAWRFAVDVSRSFWGVM